MALLQDYNKLFEHTDNIKKIYVNNHVVWPAALRTGPDYTEPFYVENIENVNETLSIKKASASGDDIVIEYSTDKFTWYTLGTTSTTALTYLLAPGDKLYLRANATTWNYHRISGISKIAGNIMSLLYGDEFVGKTQYKAGSNIFDGLFRDSRKLLTAEDLLLVAENIDNTSACFSAMFKSCGNLEYGPCLPAKVISVGQYTYNHTFNGCSKLKYIKCLAESGINSNNSTRDWTGGVSATGTFVKKAGVTWPTGGNGIPSGWTVIEV